MKNTILKASITALSSITMMLVSAAAQAGDIIIVNL